MLESGTDPESYITEYTIVYEGKPCRGCTGSCRSGFRVQGLAFRVQGLGFRVWGSGSGVEGLGFRV